MLTDFKVLIILMSPRLPESLGCTEISRFLMAVSGLTKSLK